MAFSPDLFPDFPPGGPGRALRPDLHPNLWRADQLARPRGAVVASGYDELDEQLPGGGWPLGTLTELLLPHPGVGELRLLAPALAALQPRALAWFDPPAAPCAHLLQALGLDLRQLVVVQPRQALHAGARRRLPAADILWALEQALKSGQLGAVVAWLPARLPADALRRLQLAAQGHEGPAFLLRGTALARQPSPAPLRLALRSAGADELCVQLLKRRGPPATAPLVLALPPVLSPAARARAQALAEAAAAAAAAAAPRPRVAV